MKYRNLTICIILGLLMCHSCKKDTDPTISSFRIVKETEKIVVGTTEATISGTYDFPGKINSIKVRISTDEQLFGSDIYATEVNGKAYSVHITGLHPGTIYYYRYEVDCGAKEDYLTDISEFTTQSESPTVKTIEVLALDSTTFRVKCEVVADGGSEVSERGICWNTYGDPTLDDETLQHTTGGLGQYTIRLEHLALGKKYYVRAYAKSMAGIGFGEEMEFETTSTPGMPVSIALSCNPEAGGTVSGAGSYAAGTQCTATATANPTYTFVNWTENGTQVASDAAYTFTVSVERNLVANFTKQTYVISAQVVPENSGSVEGVGGYNPGDACTLTATAKTGYTFVNWTKNGNVVSTEAEYTFTVTESATYVAHFQTKSYTISVSSSPSNGGTETGGGTVSYGQTCTVQATPAEGYIFANWTDDGDVVSTEANYTFTVIGNRSLVANFETDAPIEYTIEVSANPTNGGTVTGGGTYNQDQLCTVTAIANNGFIFANWTENGNVVSINASFTFTLSSNRTLVANFEVVPTAPIGAIYGLFSVSDTQKVWFSQGNLQYRATTNTWRFAENQWDYVGEDNSNISPTYNDWIDLFGWGTSGYDHGAVCYQPWSTSMNAGDYCDYGGIYNLYDQNGQADWGYNAISNGGNVENSGWRTMTLDEWLYVLGIRTDADDKCGSATVNGVQGIVLLPDNWALPTGVGRCCLFACCTFSKGKYSLRVQHILDIFELCYRRECALPVYWTK